MLNHEQVFDKTNNENIEKTVTDYWELLAQIETNSTLGIELYANPDTILNLSVEVTADPRKRLLEHIYNIVLKLVPFFGDIFIYLSDRKKIQEFIKKKVHLIVQEYQGPVVILAHSFSGVIVWDMIQSNTFERSNKIHFVSVGSQIKFFETLKLYQPPSNELSGLMDKCF